MNISVIIVSFNVREHLDQCLSSLERRRESIEAVVVDNCSSDGSVEMVRSRHPWARVVESPGNIGFARAVNLGFSMVSTPYAVFLNPDSVVIGDALEKAADFMGSHPSCGIAGCRVLGGDYEIQRSARGFPDFSTPFFGRTSLLSRFFPSNSLTRRNLPASWQGKSSERVDWVSGACMMVRSEVFKALGGFDENFFLYWEDADLCRRAIDLGHETWYLKDPTVLHFTGRSSVKSPCRSTAEFYKSAFRYYRKHLSPSNPIVSFAADAAAAVCAAAMGAMEITGKIAVKSLCRMKLRRGF